MHPPSLYALVDRFRIFTWTSCSTLSCRCESDAQGHDAVGALARKCRRVRPKRSFRCVEIQSPSSIFGLRSSQPLYSCISCSWVHYPRPNRRFVNLSPIHIGRPRSIPTTAILPHSGYPHGRMFLCSCSVMKATLTRQILTDLG
jgi:hypothetical protein